MTASVTPDVAKREARRARRARWTVRLGRVLVRALGVTWRIEVRGGEHLQTARASGRPVLFAFWHGTMLPLLWKHRREGVAVLISEHRDGEIIARVAESLGFRTVRGSTSRGGARALLGLVRVLEQGGEAAVTPDGPRGPAGYFAPGALVAAQRSGALIIPVSADARRAWRLRSWDRFLIPKPFARVVVAYGEARPVEATAGRDAAQEAPRFAAMIDAAGAAARG